MFSDGCCKGKGKLKDVHIVKPACYVLLNLLCAHVLLNLLNELGKRDKMHFISFSQRVW